MSELLKKRLAEKKMAKVSIGAFVINLLRKHAAKPEAFDGYLKNNIIFLKLAPTEDKTSRFLQKQERLDELNKKLTDAGYDITITDIRIAK